MAKEVGRQEQAAGDEPRDGGRDGWAENVEKRETEENVEKRKTAGRERVLLFEGVVYYATVPTKGAGNKVTETGDRRG
jgi:hypothetical protein